MYEPRSFLDVDRPAADVFLNNMVNKRINNREDVFPKHALVPREMMGY